MGCNGSLPMDPWLSPPLLSALPGKEYDMWLSYESKLNSLIASGFLSHPQNVYPSYLTPSLTLAPSNLAMSSLGLAHHNNAQNLRISPQGIASMSPQLGGNNNNIRLSPSHQNGGPPSSSSQQLPMPPQNLTINIQRHSPPTNSNGNQPPPPPPPLIPSAMQHISQTSGGTGGGGGGSGSIPMQSPQNLSISPASSLRMTPPTINVSSNAGMRIGSVSPPQNLSSPTTSSPEKHSLTVATNLTNCDGNSSDGGPLLTGSTTDSTIGITMVKESAVNMSMNNSDMRTNSIATLRIKAKEHLESINKGLTMV